LLLLMASAKLGELAVQTKLKEAPWSLPSGLKGRAVTIARPAPIPDGRRHRLLGPGLPRAGTHPPPSNRSCGPLAAAFPLICSIGNQFHHRARIEPPCSDSWPRSFPPLIGLGKPSDQKRVPGHDVRILLMPSQFTLPLSAARITSSTLADDHRPITSGIVQLPLAAPRRTPIKQ